MEAYKLEIYRAMKRYERVNLWAQKFNEIFNEHRESYAKDEGFTTADGLACTTMAFLNLIVELDKRIEALENELETRLENTDG